MKTNRGLAYGLLLSCLAMLLDGCALGITVAPGADVDQDAQLPMDKIKNNVDDPNSQRFALEAYCGHLVMKTGEGKFSPLFIAAYPPGSAPTITTPSKESGAEYHSLIDHVGEADVTTAFGVASGSFNVNGKDRLEVTVSTVAYCYAPAADKAAIANAIAQLEALKVDPDQVYFVGMATQTQMTVDVLKAIGANAKEAATPIVAFGQQAYSKSEDTKYSNYIALNVVKVNTVAAQPTGGSAPTMPAQNTALVPPSTAQPASSSTVAPTPKEVVAEVAAQAASGSPNVSAAPQHSSHAKGKPSRPAVAGSNKVTVHPVANAVLAPAAFKANLDALKQQSSVTVQ